MKRSSPPPKTELNREMKELNNVKNQLDIKDIYRTFYLNTKEYTFFSTVHGTFLKTYNILGHKASLNRYNNTEITSCNLSDHHGVKLDINKRKKRNYTNVGKLINSLLNKILIKTGINDI